MLKTRAPRPSFFGDGLRLAAAAALAMTLTTPASAQSFWQLSSEQRAMVKTLAQACRADIHKLCPGVQPGGGRILGCLEQHKLELTPSCQNVLPEARAFRAQQMPGNG